MPRDTKFVQLKRRAVVDEVARRVAAMSTCEIETEFAAVENGFEIRIRFIAEPFVKLRTRADRNVCCGAVP